MARTVYAIRKPFADEPEPTPEAPAKRTAAELVDLMGRLKAQADTINAEYDDARKELESMGATDQDGRVLGTQYEAKRSEYTESRLNTKAIREDMPKPWIARYSADSDIVKWAVKPRDPNKGARP